MPFVVVDIAVNLNGIYSFFIIYQHIYPLACSPRMINRITFLISVILPADSVDVAALSSYDVIVKSLHRSSHDFDSLRTYVYVLSRMS